MMMLKRNVQARCVDLTQAMRVTLAIRWGVPVSEISTYRARLEVEKEHPILTREQVIAWQ